MIDIANYFDYAAATPVSPAVLDSMAPYMSALFYNPSAVYGPSRLVRQHVEQARSQIAHWIGARPSEVLFTAGGTEANNLAIHGVMRSFASEQAVNMVVSTIEHEAVLLPASYYDVRHAAVSAQGIVDVRDVTAKIDEHTVLVSVMYANNEIGTIQPLRDIARRLADIRDDRRRKGNKLPIYLHTDACQAAQFLDIHAARLGVDLMTINGGKIYGPKQSGALYVRAGIVLAPLITGGGQEQGLRSGTENVAACVGLATALESVQSTRRQEGQRMQKLQQRLIAGLADSLPAASINGSQKKRLPNNVHLTVPGADNERLLIQLEGQGILAAAGSACSASNDEPSHVLAAIGLAESDARSSIRLTMGRHTTDDSVDHLVRALVHVAPQAM